MQNIQFERKMYQFNQDGESKMLAKQVSRDKEIYCSSETPLAEVFKKMTELGCACMPVVESPNHRNIIGTITEHDICEKIINGKLNPHRSNAGRFLNGDFTTVDGDATIDECARLIHQTGARRLFVVDENGAFLGVLTAEDLTEEKPVVSLETVVTDLKLASPALPAKIQMAY